MAHFFYVHGAVPTYFKNIFEGHIATQYMNTGEPRADLPIPEGVQMTGQTSVASYYGPSFMIDDLTYHFVGYDSNSILINCHYPIDANSFVLQYGIIVKKSAGLSDDDALAAAITLGTGSRPASSRTYRSGRTRRASIIRCCVRKTARSISYGAGMSSSMWTSPTSPPR